MHWRYFFALTLLASCAAAEDFGTLWWYSLDSPMDSSPKAIYENNQTLAAYASGGELVYADAWGRIRTNPLNGSLSGMESADLDEDNVTEAVVLSYADGALEAVDSSFNSVWSARTACPVASSTCSETILLGTDGRIYLADENGRIQRNLSAPANTLYKPSLGDFDGDGVKDMISVADNKLYIIDRGSGARMVYALNGTAATYAIASDINRDRKEDVFVSTSTGMLYCVTHRVTGVTVRLGFETIDAEIKPLWVFRYDGRGGPVLTAADITGDRLAEIIFSATAERMHYGADVLYIVSPGGEFIAEIDTGGEVLAAPAAGDVLGNSKKEVIAATEKGTVYVINSSGRVVWTTELGAPVRTSPVTLDFDGDGKYEALVATDEAVYLLGLKNDLDADGLTDYEENLAGTSRLMPDTDGDGIPDGEDEAPLEPFVPEETTSSTTSTSTSTTESTSSTTTSSTTTSSTTQAPVKKSNVSEVGMTHVVIMLLASVGILLLAVSVHRQRKRGEFDLDEYGEEFEDMDE